MNRFRDGILLTTLMVIVASAPFADDGSWNSMFSLSGGSIYSETENEHIALEKELLVFTGDRTIAFFQFRNASDKRVTVPCGFPVTIDVPYTLLYKDAFLIESGSYGPQEIPILDFFDTEDLDHEDEDAEMYYYSEQIPVNEFNNGREFLGAGNGYSGIDFKIRQDGDPVTVDDILIERRADDGVSATFHYRHSLTFEPGQVSEVVVEYTADLLSGSGGAGFGDTFRWNYVIGTGGTWRGPIGEFYLITPSDWRGSLGGLETLYEGPFVKVSAAINYEPNAADRFSLRSSGPNEMEYRALEQEIEERSFTRPTTLSAPARPAQGFVTNVSASSALSDRVSVFTPDGILPQAGFGPLSAFDGIPETAWSEAAPGGGVGEYLEFTITQPVWGLVLRNGFTRVLFPDEAYVSGFFERRVRDDSRGLKDYFTLNNRVKSIRIVSDTGEDVAAVDLRDSRDGQVFFSPPLESGTYRIQIADVYDGSRWSDTCLSEVIFFPTIIDGNRLPFVSDPFFRGSLASLR